jgi:membrane protease YdiL (CAAX protease family)
MRASDQRRTAGLIVFIAICVLGSWSGAATSRALNADPTQHRLGSQLFTLSLHYLVTMGWQPVVAAWLVRRFVDREPLDLAIRPPAPRFNIVAIGAAIVFAGAAGALAFSCERVGLLAATSINGAAEQRMDEGVRSAADGLLLTLGVLAALVLVWLQAVAEEVGWRGYVLPTAMRRFVAARGLVLHAVMWGVWYAPVVFFSAFGRMDGTASLVRCASFALTCVLLGILLGWLRLASDSVAPAVTANLTLTLLSGLPYVVHGIDAGLRSAIYRPIGWLVLATTLGALLLSRWRSVVRLPAEPTNDAPPITPGVAFFLLGSRRDRTLH